MKIELCLTQAELDSIGWLKDRRRNYAYCDFLRHNGRAEAVLDRILRISGKAKPKERAHGL
jgi:hypothetical protein